MHCGVMVTGYNQGDWPRLMAGDYTRPPDVADYLNMEQTLSMGELVEPLGFDSIWATEHYGSAYSMQPNPLQWLAYWAGRTSRVDVGTAVIVAPWWNPVRLASEINMLDILLRGRRLHLGIGRGIAPHEYASLGIPIEESHAYFYDVVNAVRASDGSERFTFDGKVYSIPPTTIRPQGRHKGELTTDIKAAFTTETSARLAAENGLGQMFVANDDLEAMTDKVRRFNTIRAELDLPPDQPTTLLWMYCAETSAEAEEGWDYFRAQQLRRNTTTSSGTTRASGGSRGTRTTSRPKPPTPAWRATWWRANAARNPSAHRTRSSTGCNPSSGPSASRRSSSTSSTAACRRRRRRRASASSQRRCSPPSTPCRRPSIRPPWHGPPASDRSALLPAVTHHEVHVRDALLVYEVSGEGPDLIWGHGLTMSRASDAVLGLLDWDQIPVSVVRYDARGHGESASTPDTKGYSWSELARDQLALADALGIGSYVSAGASMGCGTALHAAVLSPQRVRALVLALPPTGWETRAAQAAMWELAATLIEEQGVEALIDSRAALDPPDPFKGDTQRREAAGRRRPGLGAGSTGPGHAGRHGSQLARPGRAGADPGACAHFGLDRRSGPSGLDRRGVGRAHP